MIEIPCRICGFMWPWEKQYLIGEICDSCGGETGLHDYDLETVRKRRAKWITNGCPWDNDLESMAYHGLTPRTWDPIKQMENIPPEWR
jgi:hypothetical protein